MKEDRGAASDTFSHPELFANLKQWRTAKAKEAGQPAFWILHNTALAEISEKLPASSEELYAIKGLKGKKGKILGAEILQLVGQYRLNHNLPASQAIHANGVGRPASIKKDKPKTREESLRLFLEGRSAAEVAAARGLALSTIEGHLAHFVGTGKLGLERLMEPEKAARIAAYFQDNQSQGLTPAKEVLGEDVSYGELRFVLKDLERKGKLKTDL
jgi:ribonuclease D